MAFRGLFARLVIPAHAGIWVCSANWTGYPLPDQVGDKFRGYDERSTNGSYGSLPKQVSKEVKALLSDSAFLRLARVRAT
jgi:hypothetical protein